MLNTTEKVWSKHENLEVKVQTLNTFLLYPYTTNLFLSLHWYTLCLSDLKSMGKMQHSSYSWHISSLNHYNFSFHHVGLPFADGLTKGNIQ